MMFAFVEVAEAPPARKSNFQVLRTASLDKATLPAARPAMFLISPWRQLSQDYLLVVLIIHPQLFYVI